MGTQLPGPFRSTTSANVLLLRRRTCLSVEDEEDESESGAENEAAVEVGRTSGARAMCHTQLASERSVVNGEVRYDWWTLLARGMRRMRNCARARWGRGQLFRAEQREREGEGGRTCPEAMVRSSWSALCSLSMSPCETIQVRVGNRVQSRCATRRIISAVWPPASVFRRQLCPPCAGSRGTGTHRSRGRRRARPHQVSREDGAGCGSRGRRGRGGRRGWWRGGPGQLARAPQCARRAWHVEARSESPARKAERAREERRRHRLTSCMAGHARDS